MPSDGLWGVGSGYVPHADADYERWIVEEVPAAAAPGRRSRHRGLAAHDRRPVDGRVRRAAPGREVPRPLPRHLRALRRSRRWAAWRRRPAIGSTGCRGSGKPDGTALHWLEVNAARLPPLRFDCGTDDHLLPGNRALHAALDARGIEHQYEEFAGGHDWPYWRLHLADTLRFLDGGRDARPGRRPVAAASRG